MIEEKDKTDTVSVDARGLSCPIPVVKTQQAIAKNPACHITVLVDSDVARDNVTRLGRSRGYNVAVEGSRGEYLVRLAPPGK